MSIFLGNPLRAPVSQLPHYLPRNYRAPLFSRLRKSMWDKWDKRDNPWETRGSRCPTSAREVGQVGHQTSSLAPPPSLRT